MSVNGLDLYYKSPYLYAMKDVIPFLPFIIVVLAIIAGMIYVVVNHITFPI